MKQDIYFATTPDGVQIAYATIGSGPPLVKAANYLSHLGYDWEGPVWIHWLRELAKDHTLVRYDERGNGLSDWDVADISLDTWVRDLETVVDTMNLDRFPLLGISQGVPVAIAYAARHPDKVSHLILYGGYARARLHRDPKDPKRIQAETLVNAIRIGWGTQNPAFRQLYATMLMPDGSDAQMDWLNELARVSTTPENAARMVWLFYQLDVRDLAPQVEAPTLVLHCRDDATIPFEEGRMVATLIPGARFVALDSRNHILLEDDPAWARFLVEVRAFLGAGETTYYTSQGAVLFPELTPREIEILTLVAQGASNERIADELVISPKTVRNHVSSIYTKLGVATRAEAIVLAREAGMGQTSPVSSNSRL